jgi:hypothetical protein
MKPKVTVAFLALALTGLTFRADAQGKEAAVNPSGTWKLTTLSAAGQAGSSQTLKLKLEGGKLTGTLSRQAGSKVEQLPLEDAKFKGSDISFATHNYAVSYVDNVLQPTDTNKWSHSKYQGMISGDTIKGKIERKSWNTENSRNLDWEAKRVKATTQ